MRAVCLLAALGCGSKDKPREQVMPEPLVESRSGDGGVVDAPRIDAASWEGLENFPRVQPDRVIALPARPDVPRFDVGGPVIAGDVAVVASSQFGFLGVDWRSGTIAWSKPAGDHVAPPLVKDGSVVLIGDCPAPPAVPAGERLLGCMRVVSPTGADQAYIAIRGAAAALEPFAAAPGAQALWSHGERGVRWRRGDHAVSIDLMSGRAVVADVTPPPLVVVYKQRRFEISQTEGRIIARENGRESWSTKNAYTAVLGAVWLPEMGPMLRIANLGTGGDTPMMRLIDMDATGSLRTASGRPMPGIGLLGWAVSSIGDVAIAIRFDRSLRRDFVVGYAANAMVMFVHPLPDLPRADPVGVAIAPDAVVVFHDGDTLTILPELLAPPTAPGAGRASSQNPTP